MVQQRLPPDGDRRPGRTAVVRGVADDERKRGRSNMKVVIPAAGLGLRFLPATKSMPKEMLPVLDRPIIQYVVEEAVESGADDICIVTGRSKRAVEDHFDYSPDHGDHEALGGLDGLSDKAHIFYVRQRRPKG